MVESNQNNFGNGTIVPRLSVESHNVYLPSTVVGSTELNHLRLVNELTGGENSHSNRRRMPLCRRLKRLLTTTKPPLNSRANCGVPLDEYVSNTVLPSHSDYSQRPTVHATLPMSATICSIDHSLQIPTIRTYAPSISYPYSFSSLSTHDAHRGGGTPNDARSSTLPTARSAPTSRFCLPRLTCLFFRQRCRKSHGFNFACLRGLCNVFCKSFGRFTGRRMPNENLFVLSMIQILCGLAAVILSGVAVTKLVFLYQMATGLWSGFLMLATGFHGILTSRRCNPRTLVSLLIFCVLVALAACLLACVSVAGLIEDGLLRPTTSLSLLSSISPYQETQPIHLSRHGDNLATTAFKLSLGRSTDSMLNLRQIDADSHPSRLHQVMLHILLLVIGILEASVSVACVVLCCRQVCPSSAPPLSAMTYLQNRGATLIPGGAEFLLAVAAEPNQAPPALLDYEIPPPDFHPSVQPFLPHPGRRAYILTQAETGIHALTAAQTVAGLVAPQSSRDCGNFDSDQLGVHRSIFSEGRTEGMALSNFLRIFRLRSSRTSRRAHLRALSVHRRAAAGQLNSRLSALLPMLNNPGGHPEISSQYSASLLYVLSSPSPDEPPMIFPPFPPAYCREDTHLDYTVAPRHQQSSHQPPLRASLTQGLRPQSFNIDPFLCSPAAMAGAAMQARLLNRESQPQLDLENHRASRAMPQRRSRRASSHSRSMHTRRSSSDAGQTWAPFSFQLRPFWHHNLRLSQSQAITLIGDRILQPVLIIVERDASKDQPPCYTIIDQFQAQPPAYIAPSVIP